MEKRPHSATNHNRQAFLAHANETLKKLSETGDLPTLPAAASAALAAARTPDVDIQKLSRIIESDVGLAARVLRIANSVALGRRVPTKTLPDAIVAVGLRGICEILITACAHQVYLAAGRRVNELWNHALMAALCAQELSCALGSLDPAEAFLPGLFHDVGCVVMLLSDATGFEIIEDLVACGRGDKITLEREWYGFDHALAGSVLTRNWRLAEEQSDAIARHHDPPSGPANQPALASVLAAADGLACALGFGTPGEGKAAIQVQDLGISPEVEATCAQRARSLFKLHKNLLS